MPREVIYCRGKNLKESNICIVCGVPPEYCMFDKKDSSECKAWVLATHPELHDSIYGAVTEEQKAALEGEQPPQQQ